VVCILEAIDQEVCFRGVESKEVTRQDLHELLAGQAKTQTAYIWKMIHAQRMLMDIGSS
jgi:hypothetical protein